MLTKYAPYLLAISLFILGSSLGFFFGRTTFESKGVPNSVQNTQDVDGQENLFNSQTATIFGVITSKDAGVIKVKRLNNDTSGTLNLSKRLIVTDSAKKSTATPSGSLTDIQLNKEALISLEKIEGKFQVVTVQYILPTPSLPPIQNTATP